MRSYSTSLSSRNHRSAENLPAMANKFLLIVVVWAMLTSSLVGAISPSKGYKLVSVADLSDGTGIQAYLTPITAGDDYGSDIGYLVLTARYETENRIRVHITDANNTRWEVPQALISRPSETDPLPSASSARKLKFTYTSSPFGFAITRVSTGEVLFNSSPSSESKFRPLVFKDQYLEISTVLPQNSAIYGLGESTRPDGLRLRPGRTYTLWAADIGSFNTDVNLYGAYPYYVDIRQGGATHSVLLMNSNGMDVTYGGDYLTYKAIGGILDFYFFAGPTPATVNDQYTQLVGRPAAMPYWSLGLHQCRWGYKDVEALQSVVGNYSAAKIPLDSIWSDIDYMDAYKVFTLDPVNFPLTKMQRFLKKLHEDGQHFVMIVDPGILMVQNYSTFSKGLAMDIFVKDSDGSNFLGQVWPGPVYFPDFLHPKIQDFWSTEISKFHKQVQFDGIWIDMNEAASFCTGSLCSIGVKPVGNDIIALTTCYLNCSVSPGSKWENPPYMINNLKGKTSLSSRTIAINARHAGGELEYDVHNMYGFSESIITYKALLPFNKRPFVLSRSTFVGTGKYAAHWTGDNAATWNDLVFSVVSILNSGLFGVPMVGADICGFSGNSTEELCSRWIQVGAFYPFSRNHADVNSAGHELYIWDSVASISRKVLGLRYRLLPYMYTLVYEAHMVGAPMARPLLYEYPSDPNTLDVDSQFLLGKGILVSPVLYENATSVEAYFPKGTWYNLFDYTCLEGMGAIKTLKAPLDTIHVHLAQGSIIPMQDAALTTTEARKSDFSLVVAFSNSSYQSEAYGDLFLDDGLQIDMKLEAGSSTFISFKGSKSGAQGSLESKVTHGEFALKFTQPAWRIQTIVLLGLSAPPALSALSINAQSAPSSIKITVEGSSVKLSNLNLLLGEDFSITWGNVEDMLNVVAGRQSRLI